MTTLSSKGASLRLIFMLIILLVVPIISCRPDDDDDNINIINADDDDDTIGDDDDDTVGDDDDDTVGDDDDDTVGDDDDDTVGDDDDDTVGDDDDDDDSTVVIPPVIEQQEAYNNLSMLLSAKVDITYSSEVSPVIYVEYGQDPTNLNFSTPKYPALAGTGSQTLDVLGMKAGQYYTMRGCVENQYGQKDCGEPTALRAMNWKPTWPQPEITYSSMLTEPTQEVVCYYQPDDFIHICVDRDGDPVWYYSQPAYGKSMMIRALSSGDIATPHEEYLVISGIDGKIKNFFSLDNLNSQMVGNFRVMHHDLIEITEGQWKGAVAVFGQVGNNVIFNPVTEPVDMNDYLSSDALHIKQPTTWTMLGDGIMVVDPNDGTVLWYWTTHGTHHDSISVDPEKLPYTRWGLNQNWNNGMVEWTHCNGMLHGVDEGGEFFWISMRQQSWITKVSVETGKVLWRFGYGGDFELVDDIDAPYPNPATVEDWSTYQHSPEWISAKDGRYEFLLFDNGNKRPRAPDDPYIDQYSRGMRYIIDENTMRAQLVWSYGSSVPDDPNYFFAPMVSDLDLIPGGDMLLTVGFSLDGKILIKRLRADDSEMLWRLISKSPNGSRQTIYRATYYPSLYDINYKTVK